MGKGTMFLRMFLSFSIIYQTSVTYQNIGFFLQTGVAQE